MRKMLFAGVAILALAAASPVLAQTKADAGAAIGGTTGGAAGATAGFFVGGPVGAVIGGFTGALIGSEAGVSATTVDYVERHPVDPVYLDGPVDVGTNLSADVNIYPIDGDRDHGYIYANGRAYVVNLSDRKVVLSPGYTIPRRSVDYVTKNKSASIKLEGDIRPGYKVSGDVKLAQIPDDRAYSYVYINDRPALIDNNTHVVVWVGE
ncbi:MAG TPA: DUF1236 domain-containing protein [Arsenicitalea sp.]|jgi:hypothetical protein|nr:DUF1236 domain-containing protein [Arsenicitalea sp.]